MQSYAAGSGRLNSSHVRLVFRRAFRIAVSKPVGGILAPKFGAQLSSKNSDLFHVFSIVDLIHAMAERLCRSMKLNISIAWPGAKESLTWKTPKGVLAMCITFGCVTKPVIVAIHAEFRIHHHMCTWKTTWPFDHTWSGNVIPSWSLTLVLPFGLATLKHSIGMLWGSETLQLQSEFTALAASIQGGRATLA